MRRQKESTESFEDSTYQEFADLEDITENNQSYEHDQQMLRMQESNQPNNFTADFINTSRLGRNKRSSTKSENPRGQNSYNRPVKQIQPNFTADFIQASRFTNKKRQPLKNSSAPRRSSRMPGNMFSKNTIPVIHAQRSSTSIAASSKLDEELFITIKKLGTIVPTKIPLDSSTIFDFNNPQKLAKQLYPAINTTLKDKTDITEKMVNDALVGLNIDLSALKNSTKNILDFSDV